MARGRWQQPTVRARLGKFIELGRFEKAAALYTKVISKDSQNWQAYSNRSRCFVALGKGSKALKDAEMSVASIDAHTIQTCMYAGIDPLHACACMRVYASMCDRS